MGIPHVPDQVRRAPRLGLRAVFAGIGRILLIADRPHASTSVPDEGGAAEEQWSWRPPGRRSPDVRMVTVRIATGLAAPALPMPNYDSLSLASIRARLRGLDGSQLRTLADYERRNAQRPEVLGMLERRIEKLEADT